LKFKFVTKIILIHLASLFFSVTSLFAKSININPVVTGMNSSYLGLEDASLSDQAFSSKRTPGRMFLYTTYHWANDPWVIMNRDRSKELEPVVASMHTLDMGFSWLLGDAMQLSFQSFGSLVGVAPRFGSDNNTHIGDSRLQFKYRFLTDTYWSMAIAPEVTIPTGVEYVGHRYGASLSNSSFAPGVKLIGEYRTKENQWTFNLGYSYFDQAEFKFPNSNYPRIDGRSRIFVGTGWLYRLNKNWATDSEYSTQIPAGENHFTPPGLLTLGARYQPNKSISWHFGAGTGSLGTPGGNDPVIYAGIKVPLFGSQSGDSEDGDYQDPLLQEAYRKNLVDYSSDNSKMDSRDLEPYMNSNPVDEDSGKTLYTQDELTKKVVYKKEKIQVLDEIEFDLNMSHLTPRGRQIVHQVARVILNHKSDIKHVAVDGHTDHLGNNRINEPLSQARAQTVANELSTQGVPAGLLTAEGYGSAKPLYNPKNSPRILWEKNRRVEFNITQAE
jgi:outer membrane protein OmpA-like peptidoglycan-associated protein